MANGLKGKFRHFTMNTPVGMKPASFKSQPWPVQISLEHVLGVPIAQQTPTHTMRLSAVMQHLGWQRHGNGMVTINKSGYQDTSGTNRTPPVRPASGACITLQSCNNAVNR